MDPIKSRPVDSYIHRSRNTCVCVHGEEQKENIREK